MNKILYPALLLTLMLSIMACQPPKEQLVAEQEEMYKTALKYGDAMVARTCVYNILQLDPSKTEYKDTLMLLYFQTRAYQQAIMVAEEQLESKPEDTTVLQVLAISRQSLGLLREALEDYEALYAKSPKLMHLYEIATIQYNLKRFEELSLSIKTLMADPGIDDEMVVITYQQGQQQRVPMKAAVLNIQGFLAMDLKNYEVALQSFQQALQLAPEFGLAKGNLEALQKQLEEAGISG